MMAGNHQHALSVIPAHAAIHFDFDFGFDRNLKIKMDPSLRWDDDQKQKAKQP